MIELRNLTKNYGKNRALSDITLDFKTGEAVALLGPNGAGKSTLIKCMLGLLDFSGNITINNVDVKKESKLARSHMAYVPQEATFYDMKTMDILQFYSSLRNADTGRIEDVLDTVGLTEHSYKSTSELSGGMKQRLSFAVALITDCPVLVLDEPTSNLDKDSRAELLELTKMLKNNGKTIVFSSHRLDEVYYISDRVIFLQSGKLVKDCRMENLSRELDHNVRLNIYVNSDQVDQAVKILVERNYIIEDAERNIISLRIKANTKIQPISELLDNNIRINDFLVEAENLEIN